MTGYKRLIEYYGTASNVADHLGVSRQAVSLWRIDGIPEGRAYQVESLTRGKIKAADLLKKRTVNG